MDHTQNKTKMLSSDRILVLKKIDGEKTKNAAGLTDNSLFTGGNRLHAIMDKDTSLWFLRYDNGIIPQGLQAKWTSFTKLLEFVKAYYLKRNIEVAEVIT